MITSLIQILGAGFSAPAAPDREGLEANEIGLPVGEGLTLYFRVQPISSAALAQFGVADLLTVGGFYGLVGKAGKLAEPEEGQAPTEQQLRDLLKQLEKNGMEAAGREGERMEAAIAAGVVAIGWRLRAPNKEAGETEAVLDPEAPVAWEPVEIVLDPSRHNPNMRARPRLHIAAAVPQSARAPLAQFIRKFSEGEGALSVLRRFQGQPVRAGGRQEDRPAPGGADPAGAGDAPAGPVAGAAGGDGGGRAGAQPVEASERERGDRDPGGAGLRRDVADPGGG